MQLLLFDHVLEKLVQMLWMGFSTNSCLRKRKKRWWGCGGHSGVNFTLGFISGLEQLLLLWRLKHLNKA